MDSRADETGHALTVRRSAAAILAVILAGCSGQTIAEPQVEISRSGDMPLARIGGLQRGHSVQVPLTLNNPHRETIRIVEISMRVTEVSRARCPKSALRIGKFPTPIIGPQSEGVVLVTLSLDATSPRACDNSDWEVAFESRAEVTS